MKYLLGNYDNRIEVCKSRYSKCVSRGETFLDNLISEIKSGIVVASSPLNYRSNLSLGAIDEMKKVADKMGLSLSPEQLGTIGMSNTLEMLTLASWMKEYFHTCGDTTPNRNREIHLEPVEKKAIYEEYRADLFFNLQTPLSFSSFNRCWNTVFPFVKIREFKSVSGKCLICSILSDLRRSTKDHATRQEITDLHSLHRSTYMGERRKYYDRQLAATSYRSQYFSTISDGMAQAHSELPHCANLYPFEGTLPCHLQGIINHGRRFVIYRTFHNVKATSANLSIYTWLIELEKEYKEKGCIPDTVYHQIDGGSENANKEYLVISELLIHKRICKKIVLTRLPVGHTHEDIDAMFGIIWTKFRNAHVPTPQMAALLFSNAYKKSANQGVLPTQVHDIFAIPDFAKYIVGCFNTPARFAKEEWTIRQFIFEAVTPSDEFPLGVKGSYRHYAEDNVVEIWAKSDVTLKENVVSTLTPYVPVNVKVKVFPEPTVDRPSGGFYLLRSVPQASVVVCPFVEGSRAKMNHVMDKVRNYFRDRPHLVSQWEEFSSLFPATDDSTEYVRSKPLYVPFLNEVFSLESINRGAIFRPVPRPLSLVTNRESLLQALTTDTFQWRRGGRPVEQYRQLLLDERLRSTDVPAPAHRRERNERMAAATLARHNNAITAGIGPEPTRRRRNGAQ
jgi:hypothetical protein